MMGKLKSVFDFYIDASFHVGLAVFSLVELSFMRLAIRPDHNLSLAAFCGTVVVYNFIKFGVEADGYIKTANTYHKLVQIVSAGAFVLGMLFFSKLNPETYPYLVGLLILSGVYAIPVLPKSRNLRNLKGLKIFIVALVWAGATVMVPVIDGFHMFNWDVTIESIQRFLWILALMIPFEIRDMKRDNIDLRTLPQRYGVAMTKKMGIVFVILLLFLEFFKDQIHTRQIIPLLLIGVITIVALIRTSEEQKPYYSSFFIEGIPIIWWLLSLLIT